MDKSLTKFRLAFTSCILLSLLTGCGGSGSSLTTSPPPSGQFTHVYVVFPPQNDPNKTHFMNTVINQPAIEGVTVGTHWIDAETGTPGSRNLQSGGHRYLPAGCLWMDAHLRLVFDRLR